MNKVTFEMNNGHNISFASESTETEVHEDMLRRKVLDVPLPDGSNAIVNVCNIAYATVEEYIE